MESRKEFKGFHWSEIESLYEDAVKLARDGRLVFEYKQKGKDSLREHFLKHGKEVGVNNVKEYLKRANEVVSNSQEVVFALYRYDRKREQGGTPRIYFRRGEEIVALNLDFFIKTYFIPDEPLVYWKMEIEEKYPSLKLKSMSREKEKSVREKGDINSTLKTLIMILEEALIYNYLEENVDIELPVYLGWLSRRIAEGQKPRRELFRKFEGLYRQFIEKVYRKNEVIRESLGYSFRKYGQNRFPPEHWWWYVD